MKLSTQLMYAGNPREAADQVAALEKAGPGHRLGGRGLRLRLPHADGLPGRQDRDGRDRRGDPQHLLAHAGRAAADRGRARQRQRRPRDPRPRRLRPAGDRGLPRRALRQAAGPHPRDRRPRPARRCAARRSSTTADLHAAAARGPGHRPRQAAEAAHQARAPERPDLRRGARPEERRGHRGVRRRLAAVPLRAREGRTTSGATRSRAGAAKRPDGPRPARDRAPAAWSRSARTCKGLLDFARPMFALYVGGMGARGKNFYNDLACQYGYEKEAKEIQDLYLGGNKRDAEAVVPLELLEMCNLVGPASYVKERIAAFARGRRHQPAGHAGAGRRRRPGRHRCASSRSGWPDDQSRELLDRRARGLPPYRPVLPREGGRARTTSSGRPTARSAARCGPGPARRACSASTSTRSTAARASRTSATTWCSPRSMTRAGAHGPGFPVHTDIIVPYLSSLGTDEQKQRWLPGCVSGETITAIAMTEPGAGSDLQGIRTTAVDKGDHYVLNGSKTFISNGIDGRPGDRGRPHRPARRARPQGHQPAGRRARHGGLRARPQPRQDRACTRRTPPSCSSTTSWCPRRTSSARRAAGSSHLMTNLPQERLSIAMMAAAACEARARAVPGLRQGARGVRPADREVPAQPVRDRRDGHRGAHRPGLRRRLRAAAQRAASSTPSSRRWRSGGPPSCRRRSSTRACSCFGGYGYMTRVPDRQGVHGQPRADHLRRHHRDPEGDHRPLAGPLRTRRAKPGQVPGPADSRRPEWLHRQA